MLDLPVWLGVLFGLVPTAELVSAFDLLDANRARFVMCGKWCTGEKFYFVAVKNLSATALSKQFGLEHLQEVEPDWVRYGWCSAAIQCVPRSR